MTTILEPFIMYAISKNTNKHRYIFNIAKSYGKNDFKQAD